jgi:2-polyprenyl-3-methyl-5-hydroxy-6-metoxy-1,4-benzoquinol methylase
MIKQDYDKKSKLYDFFLNRNWPLLSKRVFTRVYDADFFLEGNQSKTDSADKVARIITEIFSFSSVFDIGCGMGIFSEPFLRLGKDVLGCDLSVDGLALSSKEFTVFQADVTKPIRLNRKYDLVLCFEVAEHIPKKYSRQLVENCAANGKQIIFTAAPPGQPGIGHINGQPYEFWINLFAEKNFIFQRELTERVRHQMKQEQVVHWIANNFMYFSME